MADILSPEERSALMSRIHYRDTGIEIRLRKALHAKGLRYRLNVPTLPGRPDLVFPKYNAVVFIHGCFWHGHKCPLFRLPGTRTEFWRDKIRRNIERDAKVIRKLRDSGWRHCTVWECSIRGNRDGGVEKIAEMVLRWLAGSEATLEISRELVHVAG